MFAAKTGDVAVLPLSYYVLLMTLPLPIVTALVGALAGALIGGLFSDFVTRRRERRSRRIRLVGELAAFYGRCEAALIRFQRIRMLDQNGAFTDATFHGLAAATETEAEGHKLYWDIREAFRGKSIPLAVWELTRRISLTKQMLMFTESPRREFAAGMNWINAQCRDVLALCARNVGLSVHKDPVPFLIGLGGFDEVGEYHSPDVPWEGIQKERAEALAAKMWAERNVQKPEGSSANGT